MTLPTICIDAGHYGKYNRSPVVPAYYESDMNWKLHLLLKAALEAYGFPVITTRDNQATDRDLYGRGYAAKGCGLFLSLHSNATDSANRENIDYPAVYHFVEDSTTKVDESSKALAYKLAPVIAAIMDTRQSAQVLTRKSSNDRNGDGMLNDNYYGVLHGARVANCPGLILEHSFHTNTRSTKWLMDDANLAKLAQAEADVIAEYFGATKDPGVWYLVATNAYEVKANAEAELARVKAVFPSAYITTKPKSVEAAPAPQPAPEPPKKSIDEKWPGRSSTATGGTARSARTA